MRPARRALTMPAVRRRRNLAAADVAAGRLVIPFDLTLPMELGFFFVCPRVAAGGRRCSRKLEGWEIR